MFPAVKTKPASESLTDRIVDTAEWLFRRFGYEETSVEHIAAELEISPARVYRLFPDKDAIVEAISRRRLGELEDVAKVRVPVSAVARMERLVLQILMHNGKGFLTERRVHEVVLAAIERGRDTMEIQRELVRSIAELILRDGIEYHLTRTAAVEIRR